MRLPPSMPSTNATRAVLKRAEPHASAARSGVTLVELLVVMLIMLLITAIAIPIVAPALSNRQIREAARLVDVFFNGAKTRALQTGQPVGVVIEQDIPGGSTTLSYAQVPSPYAGDQVNSTMNVTSHGGITLGASGSIFSQADIGWYGLVRPGDLIQFNYRSTLYRLYAGEPYLDANKNGVFDAGEPFLDTNKNTVYDAPPAGTVQPNGYYSLPSASTLMAASMGLNYSGWTYTYADPALAYQEFISPTGSIGPSGAVTFQIIRQPVPLDSGKLQLPAAAAIDLGTTIGTSAADAVAVAGSGFDGQDFASFRPFPMSPLSAATASPPSYTSRVIVTFSPSGVVDLVYAWDEPTFTYNSGVCGWLGRRVTGPIYFLVGRRELLGGDPEVLPLVQAGQAPNTPCFNYQDPSNLWVVINSQTGMISTTQNTAVNLNAAPPAQTPANQAQLQTQYYSAQVWQARAIAREMQTMGGR